MSTINQNYINNEFRLPGASTLIILNGVYQPKLSDPLPNIVFSGKTLAVPKNTSVKPPIHLLFLTSEDSLSSLELVAEENSYITIIEEHASLGDKPYTSDIKININAKTNSEIMHYKLQFANTEHAKQQTINNIEQAAGSKITSCFISKGAKIAHDVLDISLAGRNASINIKGINLLHHTQDMSNQIRISHLEPSCTSTVLAKSIVDDQAINNFACRVIANSGATKTETHVTNKNLLLSEKAVANTSPELETYVDDVICTHGATVGQLDAEALFYLRSRGITKSSAINMLISAFVQEITDQFVNYERFRIIAGLNHG